MTQLYVSSSGRRISDDMLNLLAMRYRTSSGVITLESFISLVLRIDSMAREYIRFRQLELTESKKR